MRSEVAGRESAPAVDPAAGSASVEAAAPTGPPAVDPARSGSVVAARGVGVRFGSRWVLRGADLAIGAGERVCIVGPNGAGKSTLLRCLTGVLQPTEGTIEMEGAPVTGTDRRRLARRLAVVGGDG
ncbi:MAG: ATP-binding cassette domain-containing protein, partial [Chloroflexi bacterium]|nr:ATP-binding cassette domain-containing protein [Chloroflexota bacterium]